MVLDSELNVPPSYKEFVIKFGNVKLLKQGTIYLIQVFSVPRDAESDSKEKLLNFGRTDRGLAYFKEALLEKNSESPVVEWTGQQFGLRQTANSFEEWLKKKYDAAKKQFTKNRWNEIVAGPKPFTSLENEIVKARRQYHWRVIGISKNGDLQFEVSNKSKMTLPFLSIGIRGIHGSVDGGIWLPVSNVAPGETRVIEKGCYKDLIEPQYVEAYELPDPEPEDR